MESNAKSDLKYAALIVLGSLAIMGGAYAFGWHSQAGEKQVLGCGPYPSEAFHDNCANPHVLAK